MVLIITDVVKESIQWRWNPFYYYRSCTALYIIGVENFSPMPICGPCAFEGKIPDLEEEFNILYVGITRTKETLIFSSVENIRNRSGQIKKRDLSCLIKRIYKFFDFIRVRTNTKLGYQGIKCSNLKD